MSTIPTPIQPRKKVVLQHPAYIKLLQAAVELDKIPNALTLYQAQTNATNARTMVRAAIDVLMERDPLKQKLSVIALMFLESTLYKLEKVDGKVVEEAEIIDDYLFAWAVRELHTLPRRY